jgi:hypothetical protein
MTELQNARDMTREEFAAAKRKILGLGNWSNRDRPVNDSAGDSLLKSAALIGDLKKTKPHLFSRGKSALDMTDAEYRAAKRNLKR